MLNSEMGSSLLFLCSYFIPGHSEQQGLPFLHESTAESTRQAVTIFVFHSSNRLPHLYYTFILYYLGCGSNVRYHDGVLHFSEARLHVRLILIQQELSYIGHSRVSLGHDVALSCVDMRFETRKAEFCYLKDIKTDTKHWILFQMLHQSYFINHGTPTAVDKNRFLQILSRIYKHQAKEQLYLSTNELHNHKSTFIKSYLLHRCKPFFVDQMVSGFIQDWMKTYL